MDVQSCIWASRWLLQGHKFVPCIISVSIGYAQRVTLNKTEGYLEIQWDDGQVCQYPLSELREACPCVECRGGHEFMGMEHAPDNLLELKPAHSYTMTCMST